MIPYHSIQEAESFLGRNLTSVETTWFRYSAETHDFWLYAHNLVFLVIVYTVAPLPITLIELIQPTAVSKYKLQPKVKISANEMVKCYMNVVKTFVFAVGPLMVVSYPTFKAVGIRTGFPLPSAPEIIGQLVVYFLMEDYSNYWIHRMLHSKWGYERIHHVHHEFTAPIGFAAPYAHWAEVLILGVPSFLGPAIAPGHIVTLWLWMVIRHIEAMETHCGYNFPGTPTKFIPFYGGAEYHDYHHYVGGQSRSNFASVFTYCDYIYGTDKGYRHQREHLAKAREHYEEISQSLNKCQ